MRHVFRNLLTRSLLLTLMGIGVATATLAADLTITVKQKGTGVPLQGATVVILPEEQYRETGPAGQVRFEGLARPAQIKVLATGYDTQNGNVSPEQTEVTVYLEPVTLHGTGLEVTAERIIEKTSKISLSAPELLQAAGTAGDPLQALTSLPGIVAVGEGTSDVYMRGSNSNENITWANGIPIGYLYHFGGLYSTINPALIEDINIFLGGFPVQYGDALGGVIDARLRTPRNDRLRVRADLSTIVSSAMVEGPVGRPGGDSYFIAGRRSYLDLILSPKAATKLFGDDDETDPDKVLVVPRFFDFQTLYHHPTDGGYIDTSFFSASDEAKLELVNVVSDPQLAGGLRERRRYATAATTWFQRWGPGWDSLSSVAYLYDQNQQRIGQDDNGKPFFANIQEHSLQLQSELRRQTDGGTHLTFGWAGGASYLPVNVYAPRSFDENDPNFDFTTQKKFRLKKGLKAGELSPYMKIRSRWGQRLTTQIGLRHTNLKVSGGFATHTLSPRASVEYQLASQTLLSASWGRFVQIPEGEQIVRAFGNPSLLVTRSIHRIVGLEHHFSPRYMVKIEGYHKDMDHLVIALDENLPPDNFANRGKGTAYGFDLFVKRTPEAGKIGWMSLSWAKSRRTNQITGVARDFSGDQPLTLTLVWGQPFAGDWRRWDWSIKAQVHSGTPYTQVTGRHREVATDPNSRWIPEYGRHNGKRLPTYYKVDLRIGRTVLFNERRLKFYVDIQNVTSASNIVEYDYGNQYQNIDNPAEVTGIGFFPFIGVEMEF